MDYTRSVLKPYAISSAISIGVIFLIIAIAITGVALGGSFRGNNNSLAQQTASSSFASSTTTQTTTSSFTSSAATTLASTETGLVGYSPSCFVLYSGAVHVFGKLNQDTQVKSVELFWSYHGQNNWYLLNDLVLGASFSTDGNFSHTWNPPQAAYYDFKAEWTLAGGQVVTQTTTNPFDVVAQGSSC
ncbi:MAG: hypothetical protein ACYCQJ_06790 [Nitrososphaerales archaeon]